MMVSAFLALCPLNPQPQAVAGHSLQPRSAWVTEGAKTLSLIDQKYWITPRKVYRQEVFRNGIPSSQAAFMWDYGVLLSAYAAAAKVNKASYLPRFQRALDSIEPYWSEVPVTGGYDVQPNNGGRDRYYDDNAWVALALIETYEISRDPAHLRRAREVMKFMLTGEDDKLGGGIYWHEPKKESKNTCINAPAALAALRLYEITQNQEYRKAGERLFRWINVTLRDGDGLYWDNINLVGAIEKTKWTYNTALPIQVALAMHRITKDQKWKEMAIESGRASLKYWVTDQGALRCDASFAHHLVESWMLLDAVDPKGQWLIAADRATTWAKQNTVSPEGFFTLRWERLSEEHPHKLLYQASAARAFWFMAGHTPDAKR
ncbi:MAG: glycoside hydrolase family 76 protein [Fimbriimonadaceae bacterium]|jgi:rhamnogalacturonyl hydrolase YesR|nr:glycoside hydrolase family 76 protein [Fimbriimonadaceae bacterium]